MITVIFADPSKWPLTCPIAEFELKVCDDVKAIILEGEALLLAAKEFMGLPMPVFINEYQDAKMTWYWVDAQFLARNLPTAYRLNKEATRGKA